jgi:hypothetical protein
MFTQMALVLVGTLLSASSASADESFTIAGRKTIFVSDGKRHLLISKDCEKAPGQFKCQAYGVLGKATLRGLDPGRKGGANPGALICGQKMDGQVVVGKDDELNQNAFCLFDDGSMISCGSLVYYGRKNDLKLTE